ncbi:hypothetical protein SSPO_045120 [Streptomyces antimycoticus]|uniref:Uncharacterized protein n=1 Tax=Streptomyces antimycoticus TaxID=68175 RepID=A0A499UJA5_9ACTN|nr:hypothetical protein SSPO_045120 [Streptomyces antimycoticus]
MDEIFDPCVHGSVPMCGKAAHREEPNGARLTPAGAQCSAAYVTKRAHASGAQEALPSGGSLGKGLATIICDHRHGSRCSGC